MKDLSSALIQGELDTSSADGVGGWLQLATPDGGSIRMTLELTGDVTADFADARIVVRNTSSSGEFEPEKLEQHGRFTGRLRALRWVDRAQINARGTTPHFDGERHHERAALRLAWHSTDGREFRIQACMCSIESPRVELSRSTLVQGGVRVDDFDEWIAARSARQSSSSFHTRPNGFMTWNELAQSKPESGSR